MATIGQRWPRPYSVTSGGGVVLDVEDEGTIEESGVDRLNFIGPGVTAIGDGVGGVDITIPGGISILDPPSLSLVTQFLRQGTTQGQNGLPTQDFGGLLSAGSAGFATPSSGSYQSGLFRPFRTTTAAINQAYGWRSQQLRFWRGSSAGEGGFVASMTFSFDTVQSGHRLFVGLYGTLGDPLAGADPSSRANIIAFAMDAADTTIQVMHNDGSGTATKINTGISFTAGIVYVAVISCAGGGADVTVELFTRNSAGMTSVYGPTTLNSDLPAGTQFMCLVYHANTAATTAQGQLCFHEWGVLV